MCFFVNRQITKNIQAAGMRILTGSAADPISQSAIIGGAKGTIEAVSRVPVLRAHSKKLRLPSVAQSTLSVFAVRLLLLLGDIGGSKMSRDEQNAASRSWGSSLLRMFGDTSGKSLDKALAWHRQFTHDQSVTFQRTVFLAMQLLQSELHTALTGTTLIDHEPETGYPYQDTADFMRTGGARPVTGSLDPFSFLALMASVIAGREVALGHLAQQAKSPSRP